MNTFCKDEEVYNKIIKKYGRVHQILKAEEELIELLYELKDYITKTKINVNNLITEIADVKIILQQLQIMYDITDEDILIEANKKFKKLGF